MNHFVDVRNMGYHFPGVGKMVDLARHSVVTNYATTAIQHRQEMDGYMKELGL